MSAKEADELADVRKALHLFHDFKPKQQVNDSQSLPLDSSNPFIIQFAKVVKIQKDREALPIAQYKQAIIDAVNNNQVVLIAGDTGCGVRLASFYIPLQHPPLTPLNKRNQHKCVNI